MKPKNLKELWERKYIEKTDDIAWKDIESFARDKIREIERKINELEKINREKLREETIKSIHNQIDFHWARIHAIKELVGI